MNFYECCDLTKKIYLVSRVSALIHFRGHIQQKEGHNMCVRAVKFALLNKGASFVKRDLFLGLLLYAKLKFISF